MGSAAKWYIIRCLMSNECQTRPYGVSAFPDVCPAHSIPIYISTRSGCPFDLCQFDGHTLYFHRLLSAVVTRCHRQSCSKAVYFTFATQHNVQAALGRRKCFVASDNVKSNPYRVFTRNDLFDEVIRHGLHFDQALQ